MMQQGSAQAPFNALPWVVWVICLPMIAMELTLQLGESGLAGGREAIGWRMLAFEKLAFAPEILRQALATGQWWDEVGQRALGYPLVHYGFIDTAFSVALTLALGKWVAEVMRPAFVLLVFLGASIIAALVYGLLPFTDMALVGASPGVFGLVGAFTFALWSRLVLRSGPQQSAFLMIGFLMGIQILFRLLFDWQWDWLADLAGFGVGFALTALLVPGGWQAALRRVRRR
jgi:membrane associated rhomboid family serine protease